MDDLIYLGFHLEHPLKLGGIINPREAIVTIPPPCADHYFIPCFSRLLVFCYTKPIPKIGMRYLLGFSLGCPSLFTNPLCLFIVWYMYNKTYLLLFWLSITTCLISACFQPCLSCPSAAHSCPFTPTLPRVMLR